MPPGCFACKLQKSGPNGARIQKRRRIGGGSSNRGRRSRHRRSASATSPSSSNNSKDLLNQKQKVVGPQSGQNRQAESGPKSGQEQEQEDLGPGQRNQHHRRRKRQKNTFYLSLRPAQTQHRRRFLFLQPATSLSASSLNSTSKSSGPGNGQGLETSLDNSSLENQYQLGGRDSELFQIKEKFGIWGIFFRKRVVLESRRSHSKASRSFKLKVLLSGEVVMKLEISVQD